MTPATKWNVVYADDSCKLRHTFGPKGELAIEFEQVAPDHAYTAILAGKAVEPFLDRPTLTFAFGETIVLRIDHWVVGGGSPHMGFMSLSLVDETRGTSDDAKAAYLAPAALGDMQFIEMRSGKKALRLTTGPMNSVKAVMDRCIDQLVTTWGLDPAAQRSLQHGPVPLNSPSDWLRSGDYPSSAAERSSVIHFRLAVSADGAVTGYHIQSGISVADFADVTCRLVARRARLSPALDAAGKPVASFYVDTVRWVSGY